MDIIDLIFEDYKILREESLQSMRNRNAVLTFGLGVLGVIFHAGVSSLSTGTQGGLWLSLFIFYLGIPALSLLILTLWLGEAARMTRVGIYLVEREKLINLLTGSPIEKITNDRTLNKNYPSHFDKTVFWENYIREEKIPKKTRQLKFPYIAVILLFLGVAVVSIIISMLFPLQLLGFSVKIRIVFLILGIIGVGVTTLYLRKLSKELR